MQLNEVLYFVGLAHCRHLKTVRTHLSGLVNAAIIPVDEPYDGSSGLTTEKWLEYSKDGIVSRIVTKHQGSVVCMHVPSTIFIIALLSGLAPKRECDGCSLHWILTNGLTWSLYKCVALWRAVYGSFVTKKTLGTIHEEKGISSWFRVSILLRYYLSG